MRPIGVNTWVWTSPLTDADAPALLEHVAALGFDVVELPLEQPGDLSARTLRPVLDATGLVPSVVGAMAPGRNLVAAPAAEVWRRRTTCGRAWTWHTRSVRRRCAVRSTPPPAASGA